MSRQTFCIADDHPLPWRHASSHRSSVARARPLAAVHLVEYAAQPVAVHGGLLARRHGEKRPSAVLRRLAVGEATAGATRLAADRFSPC